MKKGHYNTFSIPDSYFLEAKLNDLDNIQHSVVSIDTLSSVANDMNDKMTQLEVKYMELEDKFNALLNIVKEHFPSDIQLYYALYGKELK